MKRQITEEEITEEITKEQITKEQITEEAGERFGSGTSLRIRKLLRILSRISVTMRDRSLRMEVNGRLSIRIAKCALVR